MYLEYFVGIQFHSQSEEFNSKPSGSPSEAFEIARIGSLRKYHRVTLYARCGDTTVGIPFSEIEHLDGIESLDTELRKIAESRFNV